VVAISANFSRIVVYADGGGTTGTYQMVDFETKTATPLADAYPSIPNSAVGAVEIVDYQAGDGLGIKGILTLPSSGVRSNLPLVVIPHGGPEAMDHAGFSWLAQAFASRGYAVFQPNFRGSSGHGVAFRNAGFGQWGRKMQTDISDGVAALAARGIVDAHRACIVGASYGGYAALAGVTLQHGLYRCAASFAGVSDPAALIRVWSFATSKNPAQRYWRSYLGVGEGNDRVPDEISPLAHAAEADAPVLLIHGKDDTTVGIYQSEQMEYALKRAGKTVEFVRLDGEDHYLSRSTTRLKMLEAMVAFVEKHNPAAP
jgi:dipeptidyl aminopeptidase/acylaminoacyl peptidase